MQLSFHLFLKVKLLPVGTALNLMILREIMGILNLRNHGKVFSNTKQGIFLNTVPLLKKCYVPISRLKKFEVTHNNLQ